MSENSRAQRNDGKLLQKFSTVCRFSLAVFCIFVFFLVFSVSTNLALLSLNANIKFGFLKNAKCANYDLL